MEWVLLLLTYLLLTTSRVSVQRATLLRAQHTLYEFSFFSLWFSSTSSASSSYEHFARTTDFSRYRSVESAHGDRHQFTLTYNKHSLAGCVCVLSRSSSSWFADKVSERFAVRPFRFAIQTNHNRFLLLHLHLCRSDSTYDSHNVTQLVTLNAQNAFTTNISGWWYTDTHMRRVSYETLHIFAVVVCCTTQCRWIVQSDLDGIRTINQTPDIGQSCGMHRNA